MKDENKKPEMNISQIYGLLCVMLIGTVVGVALSYMNSFSLSEHIMSSSDMSKLLVKILLYLSTVLIFIFISGFSAIGQPFALIIIFLQGLCIAAAAKEMYVAYMFSGYLINLILLPGIIISSFCYLFAAREAILMSGLITSFVLTEGNVSGKRESLKLYCVKYLIIEAVLAIAAAIVYLSVSVVLNLF